MNSRIKEVRKAKGLSQAAFGAPFGANRDMINNVENGRAAVTGYFLELLPGFGPGTSSLPRMRSTG